MDIKDKEALFIQAAQEYKALPDVETQAQYLNTLIEKKGQDWVDCFVKYLENGDFSEFEENIAKLDTGRVTEGGTTLAENYDRSKEDVNESIADVDQSCPIAELVETMGDEYLALPDKKKEETIQALADAKGPDFAEAVAIAFSNRDFCEYIARETQSFFDTLAQNFSQSRNSKQILTNISANFSENVASSVVDYTLGRRPRNFSVLEAVALISSVARREFSENGELADALQELSDGALTPPEAENMADNIEAAAPEAAQPLEEAAKVDDTAEKIAENFDEGTEVEDTDSTVRAKEQNNAALDAIVETLKGLQTEGARQAMIDDLRKLLAEETVDYIIRRVKGEDFSEEGEQTVAEQPTEEEIAAATPELNKYEAMSAQLLGPDAYETSPVANVTVSTAPMATATLPEGAPVSEGGTTIAEDYERNSLVDQYQKLGLV